MPLRREMLFVPSLLDQPRENQIDHLPPTLRNLICTLLKLSGHVNKIEAIMHFPCALGPIKHCFVAKLLR